MNTAPPVVSNAFSEVLAKHRNGELLNEASRAMQEAVQSTREHIKPSKIIIEIDIAPANGDASAVTIVGEVKLKLPKPPKANSLFYTTDDNLLVKNDPNQKEMQLQEVKRPPAETPIVLGEKIAEANAKSAAS